MWSRYAEGIIGAEAKFRGLRSQKRLSLSGDTSSGLKNKPVDIIRGDSLGISLCEK